MLAIYKKEMRSYFINPIGYVFIGIFLLLSSLLCAYTTFQSNSYDTSTYFTIMIFALIILIPLLTMRSLSEERKLKTEQLLLTSPVSIIGIVSGKFLAAYTVFAACMVINSLYFLFLISYASLKFAVLIGNLFAILLVGMVYIAIGLFVSALTENQLSAAIGTIAIILGFLAIGLVGTFIPSEYAVRYVFDFVSIFTRFQAFSAGYLDVAALIYYISVAFIFIYLTVRIYDRRRYS